MENNPEKESQKEVAHYVCRVCGKEEILECCKEGVDCCGQPMQKNSSPGIQKKKRPIGVTIFGILFLIFGFNSIFGGIKSFNEFPLNPLDSFILFIFVFILLACGFGVLALKEWGRKLVLFYAIFSPIYSFIWWFLFGQKAIADIMKHQADKGVPFPQISWHFFAGVSIFYVLLIAGVILFYFTRPKVKEMFK